MTRKIEIEKIVKDAGQLLLQRVEQSYDIDTKTSRSDLVTSVDVEIEEYIVKRVKEKFPDDAFLTEESSVAFIPSEYTWIIDPIDGTMNFVFAERDFAISVALYKDGCPLLGIVYDIVNDEFFMGEVNHGASLNGELLSRQETVDLKDGIIDISLNSMKRFEKSQEADFSKITEKTLSHRNMGSAAIRTVHAGLGRIHTYISSHLHIWDVAASCIILNELGGAYSLVDQKELSLENTEIKFIAAQCSKLLEEVNQAFFKGEII